MKKWSVILLCFLLISCSGRHGLIPRKVLVPLLVDLNIADAISTYSLTSSQLGAIDSATFYGPIFEKYKCTKQDLDKTIMFYSTKPNTLSAVYDEVFAELNKRSETLKSEIQNYSSRFRKPVWTSLKLLTIDGKNTSYPPAVDIPIDSVGNYLITANMKMGKKDESINPKLTAYFYDSLNNNIKNRVYYKEFWMSKSEYPRQYQMSLDLTNPSMNRLHIQIPDCDSTGPGFYKNLQLTFISVSRLIVPDQKVK